MTFAPAKEQLEIIKRGTVEIIPEAELLEKLEHSRKTGKPLNIKLGCDPSRPDLHIGHAVVLNKLRQFQDLGHNAILIVGDYTAMIGDPSGKKKTRPQLTFEETREYGKTYFEQAGKILDIARTQILYNSEWLSGLSLKDMISILSKFTVQRILERDDFTNRLKDRTEISLHEILYPIMQGYDSYAINSDVELGGTDQKFNNLVGRDMQKRYGKDQQIVITMPLLEGTDGSEKMSKSLDNAIGITDSPTDIFGKTMSIPDTLIYKYFELCTKLDADDLEKVKKFLEDERNNPRDMKQKLGFELVRTYYDEETAARAVEEFDTIFRKKDIPDEIPEVEMSDASMKLVDLLTNYGLADTKSNARRLIEQGAVNVNGLKLTDVNHVMEITHGMIFKVGKRKFLKILKQQTN
ncbi:MAG: tyrosine--tRNA ligase [Ignavibacteria bacterium]|nr:tyrosine--tRNA ligase [Ignavibacteria bacterium]